MSSCALQFSSFPNFSSFESPRRSDSTSERLGSFKLFCISSRSGSDLHSGEAKQDSIHHQREKDEARVILVEKYGNGTLKRYVLDNDSQIKSFLEEHAPEVPGSQDLNVSELELPWLPKVIKDFVLPAGYPDTVSDDYLEYMLLQFPTNVTGWICHTLVTSSLLKAVGVGSFSGTTAAASAAAIRWVSKDGIGALGRLFIGGKFGNLFDDDPKQWRMYADFIGSAGSIFDLSTPLYPAYFLPLASLGNLAKAVARGLKDPSFRVIQNHFALSDNLGDVAAKEEVWEVAAELLGLAIGIFALDTPGLSKSYLMLALTWLSMRVLHLWFRYLSLSVLQFNTINIKRARILVNSHLLHRTVPGKRTFCCGKGSQLLVLFLASLWRRWLVERKIAQWYSLFLLKIKGLLNLYRKERYFLVVNKHQPEDFEVFISFKEGARSLSVLRSVWQTYWLYQNWGWSDDAFDQLEKSLTELDNRFPDFLRKLEDVGWDLNNLSLKIPKEISVQEVEAM
ncbi:protein root UVB sensitive 5 isoform X1 [Ipomoea triloba]|uniref:protein root UVB sensitive 5 isoform X1 n=1 Tax=Ipomoea triloba TaxID=35885 RepID=UPI00125DF050|nr:protein root UVB sensitive 5 isoform X1 [Ipomoea triloba]